MNYSAMENCTLEEITCAWFAAQKDTPSYKVLNNSVRMGKVFKWEPARDDIWIFKTGHIDQIKIKEFISSFVKNFGEWMETEDNMRVSPLALIDSKGKVTYLTSLVFAHLRKISDEKRKREGIEEINIFEQMKLQEVSLDIDRQTKTIIESSPTKLKDVIIFSISMMDSSTIVEIEEFLTELNYCPSYVGLLKSSSHYQLNDLKSATPHVVLHVTLFDYDCEEN